MQIDACWPTNISYFRMPVLSILYLFPLQAKDSWNDICVLLIFSYCVTLVQETVTKPFGYVVEVKMKLGLEDRCGLTYEYWEKCAISTKTKGGFRCVMMSGFPVIYFLSPSFVIGCPWVISSMFSFYLFPISQSLPTHYVPATFYYPASWSLQCFIYILYRCISLVCNLSPSRSFIFGLKFVFPLFVCFLCLD